MKIENRVFRQAPSSVSLAAKHLVRGVKQSMPAAKSENEPRAQQGVAAVDRALTILDAFRGTDGRLSLGDLAERTGLYKSTILRLIVSLEAFGYIRKGENGNYQLGPKFSELGALFQSSFRLESFVLPVLRDLVELTRESASFYIRDKDKRVCLFRIDSPQAVRDHVRVGDALPLQVGAAGKVLLRFDRGGAAVRRATPGELVIATFGERQPDTAAVAAPVFGAQDRLVGALSVSGPRVRFNDKVTARNSAAVLSAAASLSATLGVASDVFPKRAGRL